MVAARCDLTLHGTCVTALRKLAGFGFSIFVFSFLLSLCVLPWVSLSWWTVIRRCVSIAAVLSLGLWIALIEHRSIRSYGFPKGRAGKSQLLLGVGCGGMALLALFGMGFLTGAYRIEVTSDQLKLWRTVVGFVPVAFLVGVLEELVFRGYILQQLLSCSKTLALAVSSGLYAGVHVKDIVMAPSMWLELGGLCLFGFILALSYLRTGQLYFAVGLHAVLAYGARVNKLLIEIPYPEWSWLVGTSRLVNGLAGWVVLLGLGGIVLFWDRLRQQGGPCHADT